MSYADLYLTQSPLIISPDDESEPAATIFGVPFDSTHSYKPGCRFGPDAIRDAFNNIEIFEPNFGVDLEDVNIQDLGNIQHTVSATEMLDMVGKTTGELQKNKNQLIILGGEHLLTFGTYMSFPKETCYVVFDAHYDLRDQYADMKLSHAAYLRRIVEKRGAENIIHVGARAYVKEELEFLKKVKQTELIFLNRFPFVPLLIGISLLINVTSVSTFVYVYWIPSVITLLFTVVTPLIFST